MDHNEILAKLSELMRDIFDDDELTASDEMTADDVPGWDSANHIKLIIAVEEVFGVRFLENEITAPENVGQLVAMISGKMAGKTVQ
jgi:acyl carrier protein